MVKGDQAEASAIDSPQAQPDQMFAPISQSNDTFFMAKASHSSELPPAFDALRNIQITDFSSDDRALGNAASDDKTTKDDKSIKPLDSPLYMKLSVEEQSKAAKELAAEINDKGLTDRDVRNNLRTKMLQAYLDGDENSQGNEQKMNDFIKQINDNLPKGTSLKLAQPKDDPDYKKFLEGAQAGIDNEPDMKMGAHGQIQLWKTENGQEIMVGKTHYASSIVKQTDNGNA